MTDTIWTIASSFQSIIEVWFQGELVEKGVVQEYTDSAIKN